MARRYDLIGERKPPMGKRWRGRKARKELSLGRAFKGFAVLLMINAAVAFLFFALDPGFFDLPTDRLEHSSRYTNLCYKAFAVIPDAWQTVTVCRMANVAPFLVMPGIVLIYLVGRLCRNR